MTPLLDARGIAIDRRLQPTDLCCGGGEFVAIIGPNGAGKTSLLRALAGIESDAGMVSIAGKRLEVSPPMERMRLLAFLPATRGLVWPIIARDVIALGLPTRDPDRVNELIRLFELESFADRPVNSLSTGERSRVLLARTLAARPSLLLLDEPLANLDPYWVLRVLEILRARTDGSCAVLASLHDLSQVIAFDRVLLVDGGEIAADGKPADVLRGDTLRQAFGVEKAGDLWRISRSADRRSSL